MRNDVQGSTSVAGAGRAGATESHRLKLNYRRVCTSCVHTRMHFLDIVSSKVDTPDIG